MSYVALCFDVASGDAEIWSDALLAAGALSVDISDSRAGTADESPVYAEPDAPGPSLWSISRLSALFDGAIAAGAVLDRAARTANRELPQWEALWVPEQDWVRATQAQFQPLRITSDLWIVPSWCTPPDPAAINLTLDPGAAFGTGTHPTTRLCLEWLHAHVRPGSAALDYGCGSGILAIAAAKLGAGTVVGTDIDPQAVAAAAANARRNDVDATFDAPGGPSVAGGFDLVVANILTRPLLRLAPLLAARVRAGGRLALAGILDAQAARVADAYARWFNIAPWRALDGWTLLAGVRRPDPGAGERP